MEIVVLYLLCVLFVCAAFIIPIVLKNQVEELRKLRLRVERLEKERDIAIPKEKDYFWNVDFNYYYIPRDFVIRALVEKAQIKFEHSKVESPTRWQVRNS